MSSTVRTPSNKELEHALKAERMQLGIIGSIIGKGSSAKLNATFLLLGALIASGIVMSLWKTSESFEYWKIIAPLITLFAGYLWGKAGSQSTDN